MTDTLENYNGTLVHHGKVNNGIYVMDADTRDWDKLIDDIDNLANKNKYEKILTRVPEKAKDRFLSKGYTPEATIPGLYKGKIDGFYMARYLSEERSHRRQYESRILDSVKTIALASGKETTKIDKLVCDDGLFRVANLDTLDIQDLIDLYKKAYKNHSFPIFERDYISRCMNMDNKFYGLFYKDILIVSARVKLNAENMNAEIEDIATHPNYSGSNPSFCLIRHIRETYLNPTFQTIFTLVRGSSYGLNITLNKLGFGLGGTLINNVKINHSIESMNVWYSKY